MFELIEKNISVEEMEDFLKDLRYYHAYLNELANFMADDFEEGIQEFEQDSLGVVMYNGEPYIKFRGIYAVDYVYFTYNGYVILKREDDYMFLRIKTQKIIDIVDEILRYYVNNGLVKEVDSL